MSSKIRSESANAGSMRATLRFAKGPASDGSRGFAPRIPKKPQIRWAAVAEGEIISSMTKKTLVSPLTTYAEARKKAVERVASFPADANFQACRNRPWRDDVHGAGRVRVLTRAQLEEAFPATEEMVEEYFGVSVFLSKKYLGSVSLFPQTSYLCENMSWLLFPKKEEEEEEDRHYSEPEEKEDYHDRWERECSCDVAGPLFCECRYRDDD
jgi:hypothetical protein